MASHASKAKADIRKLIQEASETVQKAYKEVSSEAADKDLHPISIWASTGSFALDRAIARRLPGGIPLGPDRGRTVHIFSRDPSLGKTVLLDHVVKSTQALGGIALISETEGTRDPHFPQAIGIDLSLVHIQRPATIEVLFDAGMAWIEVIRKRDRTTPILWGVDSIESVESKQTYKVTLSGKDAGKHEYGGGRPGAIGSAFRKLARFCSLHPTTVVVLNQMRERPGILFGDRKRAGGGKALPFYASLEIELSSSMLGREETGRWVRARIVKNKLAAPFAECEFHINFEKGISPWAGLLETLEREKLVAVKRNKDGTLAAEEFVVRSTGEVLPLAQFVTWFRKSGV